MLLDNIKELHINGSKVKEAWFGGNKVFSSGGWTLYKDKTTMTVSGSSQWRTNSFTIPTNCSKVKIVGSCSGAGSSRSGRITMYAGSSYHITKSDIKTGIDVEIIVDHVPNANGKYGYTCTGDVEVTYASFASKINKLEISQYMDDTFKMTYQIYVME